MAFTFLKAQWRNLAMANYAIDPQLLQPYIPFGTELDFFNEQCYLSLVGFMFRDTKVTGLRVPFHTDFEEVNLRFYVRYRGGADWKRGVVFIREIVPRHAITAIANSLYREQYVTMPMCHVWEAEEDILSVAYAWKKDKKWNEMMVLAERDPLPLVPGSAEAFITEHYWGCIREDDCTTKVYEVAHPQWNIHPVLGYAINVDFASVYGAGFAFLQNQAPESVFLADGSAIAVKMKGKLHCLPEMIPV